MKHTDFFCINHLSVDQYAVLLALGHGDKTKEIAQAHELSQSAVQRRIVRIRHLLKLDSTELLRMFSARFVAFIETELFEFCPGGQPELKFKSHEHANRQTEPV